MLSNFLNIEGVTVLDKKQQSKVVGGTRCYFRLNGTGEWIEGMGVGSSSKANELCVDMIVSKGTGVSRCQYDCDHDGIGQ